MTDINSTRYEHRRSSEMAGLIRSFCSLLFGFALLSTAALGESISHLTTAAESGDAQAQFELGLAYDGGNGVVADIQTALSWYRRAAEQSHAEAMYYIALTFDYADRVDEDNLEAADWYRRAGELDHAESQAALGLMYEIGEGVETDLKAARNWYERAANNGNADGMGYLGDLYMRGAGVDEDRARGRSLLEGSASGGSFYGQIELAKVLLETGDTEDDRINGLAWLLIAGETASNGSEQSARTALIQSADASQSEMSSARRYALTLTQSLLQEDEDDAATGYWLETSEEALIEAAQKGLRALGYYAGDITGTTDEALDEALADFAAEWRYAEPPAVTPNLLMFIGGALAYEVYDTNETDTDMVDNAGSGFYVSASGQIVTNEHVIAACDQLSLPNGDVLEVIASETSSDLALLQAPPPHGNTILSLRAGRGVRSADPIWVAGYPLGGYITSDLSVASGTVMALAGMGQDRREFQISAPVQPGNSGGPVLDEAGRLVGVVVSGLDKLGLAAELGDLPENINFAISLGTLQSFLDTHHVDYLTAADPAERPRTPIIEPSAIVAIMCE